MAEKAQQALPMMVVPEDKMVASSVIPVIGGNNAPVVGSIKNVMDEDPSILQVKQEDIGVQESPFLRIMGWLLQLYHTRPYNNTQRC